MSEVTVKLKKGWENAFYRGTMCYIAALVTIIFSLQIYRFFFDLPSSEAKCGQSSPSVLTLVPVFGVLFDEEP